jgi:hypothetical protein
MIKLKLFKTPINIHPMFSGNVIGLWVVATLYSLYRHPQRDLWSGILIGLAAMLLVMVADIGHAIAHIFSARAAKAPMNQILLTSGMPRTLYNDNEVSPTAHRTRALGGPVFSAVGLVLSLVLYIFLQKGSIGSELAGWSLLGHSFIFSGILIPLPIVDGGTILKWTLVEKGRTESEADQVVRNANWGIGILAITAGVVLLVMQTWIVGIVALGVGAVAIGAGMGKIK